MTTFKAYLSSRKVQKVLSKRPGEEGFSLIELVVVIAVLAILAAVAIPAFNGIQNDAKASAVKSGMANGIKECLVRQARGQSVKFNDAKAFTGEYNGYTVDAWNLNQAKNATGTDYGFDGACMAVHATPDSEALPEMWMAIDGDGEVFKSCESKNEFNKENWDNALCW